MTERNKGIFALLFLAFLWAAIAVIPRYLEVAFTVYQQVYLRLFVGFILSLIVFKDKIRFSHVIQMGRKDSILLTARSFSYYALGVVLFTQAVLIAKIGNVAFIDAVPMTAVLGFILLREKFYWKKALFVTTSFLGVLFISAQEGLDPTTVGFGEMLALISAFFISLAMVSRKWHSNNLNDQELGTIMLLFGSIFVFMISIVTGESLPLFNWGASIAFFVLLGGLMNTGISYFVNYGLSRVDAVLSGNIFALTPVFALLLGFVLFKEIPIAKEIAGGTLIFISVIALHNLEKRIG